MNLRRKTPEMVIKVILSRNSRISSSTALRYSSSEGVTEREVSESLPELMEDELDIEKLPENEKALKVLDSAS